MNSIFADQGLNPIKFPSLGFMLCISSSFLYPPNFFFFFLKNAPYAMRVFPWLKTLAYCLSMSIKTISYQKVVTKRKRIVNVKSIVSNFISGFILCWSSVIFSSINYILGVHVIETNSPQNICSGPTRIACML